MRWLRDRWYEGVHWLLTLFVQVIPRTWSIDCAVCFLRAPFWWNDMKQLAQYFSAHSTHALNHQKEGYNENGDLIIFFKNAALTKSHQNCLGSVTLTTHWCMNIIRWLRSYSCLLQVVLWKIHKYNQKNNNDVLCDIHAWLMSGWLWYICDKIIQNDCKMNMTPTNLRACHQVASVSLESKHKCKRSGEWMIKDLLNKVLQHLPTYFIIFWAFVLQDIMGMVVQWSSFSRSPSCSTKFPIKKNHNIDYETVSNKNMLHEQTNLLSLFFFFKHLFLQGTYPVLHFLCFNF